MSKKETLSSEELQELFGKNDSDSSTGDEKSLSDNEEKREDSHFVSTFQSAMMLARFCVGSGLFSIPAALRYSGIAVGIIWININGFLTAYGMKKLVELSWEVSRRTGSSAVYYGDIGEECARVFDEKAAKFGRIFVNIVLVVMIFGALLCTQLIYMAEVWKQGFEQLGVPELDISTWIFVVYCVLFPLFQIRRPDALAACSIFANGISVLGIITIFVHIFSNGTFRVSETIRKETNEVDWFRLPLTIGITSYAYQLVAPLIITMKNVMKKPEKSPFVINIVMAGVTVLYALMGALGYAFCFPECKDSIVLNLPRTRYYSIVQLLLGMSSLIGTTLGIFICFNIVEPVLRTLFPENRFLIASTTSRIFALTFAAGITAAVPQLGNVMSLAGTLINPTLGFIFPAIAHIAIFYRTHSRISIAKNIVLLVCGLLILVTGVYTSAYEIVYDP